MADAGTGHLGAYLHRGLTGRITTSMATEFRNLDNMDLRSAQVQSAALKLNSRDYTATSGEINAIQSKPNISVGGTTTVTTFEASPRFATGTAGGRIVGFKSNPDLKSSSTATTIVGPIRCFEAKFDGGSGRTVTNQLYILDCMTANAATVTGGCYVIGGSAAGGGGTGWTGFIHARTSGAMGVVASVGGMGQDLSSGQQEDGYIDVYIDTTRYQIPLYAMT